jgi:hypothetical protein
MPADYKRPAPNATAANWKGQSEYAGAKNRDKMSAQERIAAAQPGYSKPAAKANKAATRDLPKAPPKVQGNYAGAKGDRVKPTAVPATRDVAKPKPQTRDVQQPKLQTRDLPKQAKPQGDRGYAKPAMKPAAKPQQVDRAAPKAMPSARPAPAGNRSAMSGANKGKADKAASQRGKQSLPQGARSKGGGHGGGKKQKR